MNKYLITNHHTKEKVIVEASSAQEAARQVGCRIKDVSPADIGQPGLSGMTLQKAKEILKDHVMWCDPVKEIDTLDALKLGIEAIEAIEIYRSAIKSWLSLSLPGETEE